jgi:hypothetical protein
MKNRVLVNYAEAHVVTMVRGLNKLPETPFMITNKSKIFLIFTVINLN